MELSRIQEKAGGESGGFSHSRLPPPPAFLKGFGKSCFTRGLLCFWKQCKFILAQQGGPSSSPLDASVGRDLKNVAQALADPLFPQCSHSTVTGIPWSSEKEMR